MRVLANGVTLNIREQGNRNSAQPTLMLLHYFGGSSWEWLQVMDNLAHDHYCVAADLRGFGDSDAPEFGYTVSDGADDIAALIQALDLQRYVLIGHSMSGKIALAIASRRPMGLEQLILFAPSPPSPEPMAESERAHLLATHGERAQAEGTVRKITARTMAASQFGHAVDDNLRSSWQAWSAWLQHGSREDISSQMPNVAVPVTVVVGTSDPVLPAPVQQQLVLPRLANVRIETLVGVGHLSPLEAPVNVLDSIRKSLA